VSTVRYLSLSFNRIGRPGVEALAASPRLAGLHVLDLTKNPCDPVPRPAAHDLDGRVPATERPAIPNELEARFGPRPRLANPDAPDSWPLPATRTAPADAHLLPARWRVAGERVVVWFGRVGDQSRHHASGQK
jgi:hypothetical protein